jgi:hypothetical protein
VTGNQQLRRVMIPTYSSDERRLCWPTCFIPEPPGVSPGWGYQFYGFTTALCSESDGGSTSNVLTLMLYWSEKMIRNSMYLSLNTRLIHKTSNRLTLITVFCFRVDPRSLLWRYIKLKNSARLIIPGYVKTCQILSSILFMSYKLWLNNYSLGHQCPGEYRFRNTWWMSDVGFPIVVANFYPANYP